MSDKPSHASPSDRRAWVRYPCNLQTLYQPGGNRLDHHWWFAKVRDISTHGIGLFLDRHFEAGCQLTIALYSATQDISRTVEATVVHIESQKDGSWSVGCSFEVPVSEEELRAFWSEQRLSQALDGMTG